METTVTRPFPTHPDAAYADHIAGLAAGELVVRRCAGCEAVQWPPRATCAHCHGVDFAPHRVEAAGEVYTFTVVHRAFHPWFADRLPYGVAIVDLPGGGTDGVRLTGLFDGDPARLRCGLAVVGRGEELGGAPALLWSARPAGGAS